MSVGLIDSDLYRDGTDRWLAEKMSEGNFNTPIFDVFMQ
jgi:hypothetical protein